MVRPTSASCCSIHDSGNASAVLWPLSRRANSATKALDNGGLERAMSATVKTRFFGSSSTMAVSWSAQSPARRRSVALAATRAATRRRFSISASRSMMGTAHNSPSLSTETV